LSYKKSINFVLHTCTHTCTPAHLSTDNSIVDHICRKMWWADGFGVFHKVDEKINTHILEITTKSHLCFHFSLSLSLSFYFSPLSLLCFCFRVLPFPLANSLRLTQFLGRPIDKYFIALWLKSELFDYFLTPPKSANCQV